MGRATNPALAREVAVAIVRTLREAGYTAYFAGGCVRDALLGLSPTDYDVATDAVPQVVRTLFRSTDEVGAAFGVVLVHQRGGGGGGGGGERVTVEVATFRSDGPYSDSRRPDTVHFSDPRSDAARRDFTINAMFLDPLAEADDPSLAVAGRLIDYFGGLADLRAGVIRAVGDPDRRLAEDHLRALRAVRFAARLAFGIEPATAAAIRRHAAELRGVSRERIGDEIRRMFGHPSFPGAIALLEELGLDAPVLNEAPRAGLNTGGGQSGGARPGLGTVRGLPSAGGTALTPMRVLAAWLIDRTGAAVGGLGVETIAAIRQRARSALCLSNEECEELGAVLTAHQQLVRAWGASGIAIQKRWAASGAFVPALQLVAATDAPLAMSIQTDAERLASDGIGLSPAPLVDGDILTNAGLKPGPAFGRILSAVYDAQLEGRVRTPEAALELARRLYV